MADDFTLPAWRARPALKEQLVTLTGSQRGYLDDVLNTFEAMPGAKRVSKHFVSIVLNGQVDVPMWAVIALTRIAEDNLQLDRDTAVSMAARWFRIDGGE